MKRDEPTRAFMRLRLAMAKGVGAALLIWDDYEAYERDVEVLYDFLAEQSDALKPSLEERARQSAR